MARRSSARHQPNVITPQAEAVVCVRMAKRPFLLLALTLSTLTPASASPQAVVEMFTSQGCSSCPPADAYLSELARRPEIVALTLPVDYWDYLGWKDTLAHSDFTARQRAYAGARGDRQVYTPQAVVNGGEPCVGSNRAKIERLIAIRGELPVPVAAVEAGGQVAIEVGPGAPVEEAAVWLLPVARARTVPIGRGENRGRTSTYVNVVRGLKRVGTWTGQPARYEVPMEAVKEGEADAYVVLLQAVGQGGPGPILGAAKSPGF
jgi:hypothetical protein